MSDKNLTRLWELLDQQRRSPNFIRRFDDLSSIFNFAKENNIDLDLNDLRSITKRSGIRVSEGLCPQHITEFIENYLFDIPVKSILDPWSSYGSLLIPLVEKLNIKDAIGINKSESTLEVAKILDTKNFVSWQLGDPMHQLEKMNQNFDVIASSLPFGVRPQKRVYEINGDAIEIHDDKFNHVILKSCLLLSTNGVGLFTVPLSFIFASRKKSVFNNLERFGLSLEAFLNIPVGTFRPYTTVQSALAIFRKGNEKHVFVGQLSEIKEQTKILLRNLKNKKEGKEIAVGRFVTLDNFKGYHSLVANERIKRMAKRMGVEPIPIEQVATEINLARGGLKPSRFEEKENAVYLPLIGRSNAITSLPEMTLKQHNYIQLSIKPEIANARYVAEFFNSPIGHAIRESAYSGVTIPKITKNTLLECQLFLPELKEQIRLLETDSKVQDLISELTEIRDRLWSQPRKLNSTINEVKKVNKEERFKDWLDNLPFPLASILWNYHAEKGNPTKQFEHLDYFFEALSQFMGIILLSAFSNDSELFAVEKLALNKSLAEKHLSLERSTFGAWVSITERLSKQARELCSQKSKSRNYGEELFKISDREFLETILSKSLITVLKGTNNLRNSRAHGGIISEELAKNRLLALQKFLSQVRTLFGDIWNRYQLILPRKMIFTEGLYNYNTYRLMGALTPFESEKYNLARPLEDGHLHFIGNEEREALQLLPFIKVIPSPSNEPNACYFFNRKKGDSLEFKSYHHKEKPEIEGFFHETLEALKHVQESE